MPILTLPFVSSVVAYKFSTSINNTIFWFDVRWNRSDQSWYFDVRDEQERPVRSGIKVVLGGYLGRMCVSAPFRDGAFVAVDTSGTQIDAGFDDLGSRVQILYLDSLSIQGLQDGKLT